MLFIMGLFTVFPPLKKIRYFLYAGSSDIVTAVVEREKDFYHILDHVLHSWSFI